MRAQPSGRGRGIQAHVQDAQRYLLALQRLDQVAQMRNRAGEAVELGHYKNVPLANELHGPKELVSFTDAARLLGKELFAPDAVQGIDLSLKGRQPARPLRSWHSPQAPLSSFVSHTTRPSENESLTIRIQLVCDSFGVTR